MSRHEEYNRLTGKHLPEKGSLSTEEVMRRAREFYPDGLSLSERELLNEVLKDKL